MNRPNPYPRRLEPLCVEAIKSGSWEKFRLKFSLEIKRGVYWHITKDKHFSIDPEKGPRDMSSMSFTSTPEAGKLMITSDLDYWLDYYGSERLYAAQINMDNVRDSDYWQVSRGFGNEFYVNDPSNAYVMRVVTLKSARRIDREFNKALNDFLEAHGGGNKALLVFYQLCGKKYRRNAIHESRLLEDMRWARNPYYHGTPENLRVVRRNASKSAYICKVDDCDRATTFEKPYCRVHIAQMPYAASLKEKVGDWRKIKEEAYKVSRGGKIPRDSPVVKDIINKLGILGGMRLVDLAHSVGLPFTLAVPYFDKLEEWGMITRKEHPWLSEEGIEDYVSLRRPSDAKRRLRRYRRNTDEPSGDCFDAAVGYMLDNCRFNPDCGLILVHAEVTGYGPIRGIKYGHAFVLDGDMVVDVSNNRKTRVPKAVYYHAGRIGTNLYKYTFEEMRKKLIEYRHYGPWDLETEHEGPPVPPARRNLIRRRNPIRVSTWHGWETPGPCYECGSHRDWDIDGRGDIHCKCQIPEEEAVEEPEPFSWSQIEIRPNTLEHLTTAWYINWMDSPILSEPRLVPMKNVTAVEQSQDREHVIDIATMVRDEEWFQPIVVEDLSEMGFIIDGHHRLLAMKDLGTDEIYVQEITYPEGKSRRNTDRREGGLPGFNKWVEPRLKPREYGVTYWDDLSETEQAAVKQQHAAELDELFEMEYPFKAKFTNEDVMVLGPQSTFLPEPDGSIRKTQWVRAKRPDGSTFATLASSIFVDGSPLITKGPPRRVAKTRLFGFGSDLGLLRKEYERLKGRRENPSWKKKRATTDFANLKRNQKVIMYHATQIDHALDMVNGFDANEIVRSRYNGPPYRGLFVSPIVQGQFGNIVLELSLRTNNLHGTDYNANIGRASDPTLTQLAAREADPNYQHLILEIEAEIESRRKLAEHNNRWSRKEYPNSFRPYLSETLLQNVEPQAIYRGLVSPDMILRIQYYDGTWLSRKEFIEKYGKNGDKGIDLSSPNYTVDEYLNFMAEGDSTHTMEETIKALQRGLQWDEDPNRRADNFMSLMKHFNFGDTAIASFKRKFINKYGY